MTCQICGRDILAGSGAIAHHGYQRPGDGYQTGSCYGALKLPFEVSRDALGHYITAVLAPTIDRKKEHLARMQARDPSVEVKVHYQAKKYNNWRREQSSFVANAASYEQSRDIHRPLAAWPRDIKDTFEEVLLVAIARQKNSLRMDEAYMVGQEVRFNDWKPVTEAQPTA